MTIDGLNYSVLFGFRNCLKIMLDFEDLELMEHEKRIIMLSELYKEIPGDIEKASREAIIFLDGGRGPGGDKEEEPRVDYRLFSFEKDASFIFSAFRQTHGLNLQTATLHWWEFLALFMDLGQDTTFCRLIALRKRVKTGKATPDERLAASEMGEIFIIDDPDTRTPKQKEKAELFDRLISEGEEKRKRIKENAI